MGVEAVVRGPFPPRRPLPAIVTGARSVPLLVENAAVVGRQDLSGSVTRFRVRPDARPPHVEPGQYLTLGSMVDGRPLQRPYSTATPAGVHEELEFLIRLVPGGALTPRLWDLRLGDRLRLGRPNGLFTRIPGDPRTHLFIATGTGLAPFVGMIETLLREPSPPRAVAVHGVAHVAELAYRERFERWSADGVVTYVPSVSRPAEPSSAGWAGRTGRIDTILDDVWAAHDLTRHDTVAYLCGHPEMIASGERILAARGLSGDAIRSEHYWPI